MVHVLARSERRFGHAVFMGSGVVGGRCVSVGLDRSGQSRVWELVNLYSGSDNNTDETITEAGASEARDSSVLQTQIQTPMVRTNPERTVQVPRYIYLAHANLFFGNKSSGQGELCQRKGRERKSNQQEQLQRPQREGGRRRADWLHARASPQRPRRPSQGCHSSPQAT